MNSTWKDIRTRRRPNEGRVAEHRAEFDAAVQAHRLSEVRAELGLTQEELARRMNVTQPSVSAFERGELGRAGLDTIRAYVEALGGRVDVVARFGDERIVLS